MFLLLFILMLPIPIATFLSLLAGIKVFAHTRALAGLILLGAFASILVMLWSFRYDIDPLRNLIVNWWGYEGLQMELDLDLGRFFIPLYYISALADLLARFRWKPQYGSAILLNLALVFWVLATIPFLFWPQYP